MSIDKTTATALRKPFPPESIGKLPKGGVMLDYVGHAAVTDRLLTIDPEWSWEPMGVDQFGLPVPDSQGNLWIRLTVCGVTRIGVGDGKSMKERIGDAIRNAAMRFGVALDLWAKEDLVEFKQAVVRDPEPAPPPPVAAVEDGSRMLTNRTSFGRMFYARMGERNFADDQERIEYLSETVGRLVTSSKELTEDDARKVLARLDEEAGIEPAEVVA